MHCIIVEPTCEGFRIKRPGWPPEYLEESQLADRLAASLAHEFHAVNGRPACAMRAPDYRVIARFG